MTVSENTSFRLSRGQKSGFCRKNEIRRLDSGKINTIDKRWFKGNLKFGKFSLFFELKAEQTFRCERRTLALSRATADECRYTRECDTPLYKVGRARGRKITRHFYPTTPRLVSCLSPPMLVRILDTTNCRHRRVSSHHDPVT